MFLRGLDCLCRLLPGSVIPLRTGPSLGCERCAGWLMQRGKGEGAFGHPEKIALEFRLNQAAGTALLSLLTEGFLLHTQTLAVSLLHLQYQHDVQ